MCNQAKDKDHAKLRQDIDDHIRDRSVKKVNSFIASSDKLLDFFPDE